MLLELGKGGFLGRGGIFILRTFLLSCCLPDIRAAVLSVQY